MGSKDGAGAAAAALLSTEPPPPALTCAAAPISSPCSSVGTAQTAAVPIHGHVSVSAAMSRGKGMLQDPSSACFCIRFFPGLNRATLSVGSHLCSGPTSCQSHCHAPQSWADPMLCKAEGSRSPTSPGGTTLLQSPAPDSREDPQHSLISCPGALHRSWRYLHPWEQGCMPLGHGSIWGLR